MPEDNKQDEVKTFEFKSDEKLDENIREHIAPEPAAKKSFFRRLKPELPKRLVKQPVQVGAPVPGKIARIKRFFIECRRVLRVTKKPDKQEFMTIVKVSALGMAIIGVIGFLITLAKELMFK